MQQLPALRRVFIHGAGRRGRDAWPDSDAAAGGFVSFEPGSNIQDQVETLINAYPGARVLLHAHSIGAVPAVLAAASGRLDVAGLVLVEPALYDIARGEPAIERHIAIVTEARAQTEDENLQGFWAIFRPLMFGEAFDADSWDAERAAARQWATSNVPWGHGVRIGMTTGITILVVTGGWNDEYETIAGVLTGHGARHIVLEGATHRPQDLPGFAPAVEQFARAITAPSTTSDLD
ncbi:alpha/beta fold hydrolase [Microbacterium sp. AK031]|uniref:alpha/beta fold hydrolase n=1 Tax=Microbacterium sp. AK031 TaxID=2723076 RepID=UPI00216A5DF6|nr:alpha/beta fold hydrolase [Microbacterium sp. AK031]MCS3842413.1 pimeloyl-ACP methyl ester carboxylesterase [Microbacterium sp. AK031]